MHLIDFIWALLSVTGAAVPVYRLCDNLHRPGAPYLLGLVGVCAVFPWAYIVYPYTPFDQGLVMSLTTWIGPFYLLGTVCYLGAEPPGWRWMRNGMLLFAAAMSALALSNPLHGVFSTFMPVTPDQPLTTIGQLDRGVGMTTMGGVSIACIIASVGLIGFYYHRSRFDLTRIVAMTVFPVASGIAYALQAQLDAVVPEGFDPFVFCTTAGLWMLTYALLRGRFLEVRPITRKLMLNLIPDAVAVVSTRGIVADCNIRFAALLGSGDPGSTIGVDLAGRLPEAAWTLRDEPEVTRSIEHGSGAGMRYFQVHLVRLDRRDERSDVLVLLRDVTEQTLAHESLQASRAKLQSLNAELARLSTTDALTGLRNRRYFLDQLAQECERASRHGQCFALLSVDLDHFKRINDSYGHAAGDEALVRAARAMECECRVSDTLARVGGEEFMVLLVAMSERELEAVAERFRQAIERTAVCVNGRERLALTASIGGVLIEPGVNTQAALKLADEALYAAKGGGRNRVVLNPPADVALES